MSRKGRVLAALVTIAALAASAVPAALAAFPYSRPGATLTDYTDLWLDAGQTPNDLDGDDNRFKYAATPNDSNGVNNSRPTELGGVRGGHVVDSDPAAETAWRTTTGRPDVTIATLDSGIEWNNAGAMNDLRFKTRLNSAELPVPNNLGPDLVGGSGCASYQAAYDANADGVFDLRDYACDDRVDVTDPRRAGPSGTLTPQDVLIAFSNDDDADSNGYVDDIVGWDFLDDDNDPYDDVQYGHGTGEAQGSTSEADNGTNAGSCPNCMVIHMRVGDSFIADVNRFAEAVIYATDNGALVIQEALGTLNNSSHARDAVNYAYRHGVTTIASAADEAAQHNNWPSSLPHVILVNSVTESVVPSPDQSYTAFNGCTNFNSKITLAIPSTSCSSDAVGVGSGLAGLVYSAAYNAFDKDALEAHPGGGCTLTGDGPDPGSAGPDPCVVTPNEVRQLMASGTIGGRTQVEDINFASPPGGPFGAAEPDCTPPVPTCTDPNLALQTQVTTVSALPVPRPLTATGTLRYPARAGHDQFYGYGRVNMNRAVSALVSDPQNPDTAEVPPQVELTSPEWYEQIDPARASFEVRGEVFARDHDYTCRVLVAPGHYPDNDEAPDGDFTPAPSPGICDGTTTHSAPLNGALATVDTAALMALFPLETVATGFVDREPGAGAQTSNGRPNTDPYGFVVRVVATTTRGATTMTGEDQRAAFLHRDQDMLSGFPRAITGGGQVAAQPATPTGDGESSPLFADLDGDNRNELVFGSTDGFVHALRPDGSELPGWPVRGDVPGFVASHGGTRAYASGEVSSDLGGAIISSVAVADADRDGVPEVYAADLEGKLYGWDDKGQRVFEQEANVNYSGKPTAPFVNVRDGEENRTQHGFIASPVLADLDGDDGGKLEIVAANMDRHVYAWNHDGSRVKGYPVLVVDPSKVASVDSQTHRVAFGAPSEQQGAIIDTPAVGDLDGDPDSTGPDELPEIVVGTNEEYPAASDGGFNAAPANGGSLSLLAQAQAAIDEFKSQCGSSCDALDIPLSPGNSRLYVVEPGGDPDDDQVDPLGGQSAYRAGWPARIGIANTGLLPVVGEGITGYPVIAPATCPTGASGPKIGVLANNGPAYVLNPDAVSCYGRQGGMDVPLQSDVTPAPTFDHPLLPAVGHPAFGNLAGDPQPTFLAPAAGITRALDVAVEEYQRAGQDFIAAWSVSGGGQFRPDFPVAVNDLQFLTGPSVGDLDGLPGEEIVEGTASKDLAGLTGAGTPIDASWPKLSTDWTVANPLIGSFGTEDTDPEATKVVVGLTRSGYVNVYETDGPACSPSSWPRFHHDNANSGDYSRDAVLPGKPQDALLASGAIAFTAPGDDLLCGDVDHYEVVTSDQPIAEANFDDAEKLPDATAAASPGATESYTPPGATRRYIGIRAVDEQGNVGRVASLDLEAGPGPDPGPPDPTPEPDPPPGAGGGGDCPNIIPGGPGADKLNGTDGSDKINGQGGPDKIKGGSGDDCLRGGRGRDKVSGGEGDDKIHVRAGRTDKVNCGPGKDTVVASKRDKVRKSCERIKD